MNNNKYNLEIWKEKNKEGKYTGDYILYPSKEENGIGGIKYTTFLTKHLKVGKADYSKIQPIYVNTDEKRISFWSKGQLQDYKLEPIKEYCSPDGVGGEKGWFWSDRVFRASIHPDHLIRIKEEIKNCDRKGS